MLSSMCNQLALTLLLLISATVALQTQLKLNYAGDLLRQTKAAEMLAFMDKNYKICDNYYDFACGNWKRTHPAKNDNVKTSYLGQLKEFYKLKCINMLKSDHHRNDHKKLRDFFESCSNEAASVKSGLDTVLRVVNFTGWPNTISDEWYENNYDWLKTIAELRRKLGVNIFVGLEIVPDYEDKNVNRIRIGAPKLEFGSKHAYLGSSHTKERQEYRESITRKLRKYFSNMPAHWATDIADQILAVEQALAKGLPDNPNLTPQQTTRKRYAYELKAAYGDFVDLSRYLMLVFNQTIQVLVYETPEDYMSNLVEVIKNTPKLTMANYTMWRVLEAFDFAGAFSDEHNDNWCLERITENFPKQLEEMYHQNFNAISMQVELLIIWDALKAEIRLSHNLNWMTAKTRLLAMQKVEEMGLHIERPDNVSVDTLAALEFDRRRYYDNLLQTLQWHSENQLAKLNKKPYIPNTEEEEEILLPKYDLSKNQVKVPVIFLQPRFLSDPAYPQALKYSTLGVLLAQQMLHGFDAQGLKYDKHGKRHGFWDTPTVTEYNARGDCFAHQYEGCEFCGKDIFNASSISDIVIFNGALGVAYRAYEYWLEKLATTTLVAHESLPELFYKPQQLFFLGFAQLWCADYSDNALPERLSVNGALANLVNFANEFSCRSDSRMDSSMKCVIY